MNLNPRNSLKHLKLFDNFDNEFKKSLEKVCCYFDNEAFVIDKDDNVFYLVNNCKYKIDALSGQGIVEFTYAYFNDSYNYHMMALTKDGRVYGWGRNELNQVVKKADLAIYKPEQIKFTFGYVNKFRVYLSNYFYQFSETSVLKEWGLRPLWTSLGHIVKPRRNYTMIACGTAHCMAVTDQNNIVLWGSNHFGQIGNGLINTYEEPYEILVKKEKHREHLPLSSVQCAKFGCTSCSATLCGVLFPWGLIGLIPLVGAFCCCCQTKYRVILSEEGMIESIACGAYHNLVLFDNDNLWGWGNNELGQLGRIPSSVVIKPVPIFSNVKAIAAFNFHSLVLCNDHILYCMGDNTFGQLGDYYKGQKVKEPVQIDLKISEIATIGSISVAKTLDGNYFAWGLYKLDRIRKLERKDEKDQGKGKGGKGMENKRETIINDGKKNVGKKGDKKVTNEEEVDKEDKVLKDEIKAHIIVKPKRVRCVSFNDFFARLQSITYFTIDMIDKELYNYNNEQVPTMTVEELIDPSELEIIDFSEEDFKFNNVFHIGDKNKFSLFENCDLKSKGNITLSDIKQLGREMGRNAYQKVNQNL